MEDILLQKQMEVQLDIALQKLKGELELIKKEISTLRDDVSQIKKAHNNIQSSHNSRGDFQVSSPRTLAPSGQAQTNTGHEGYSQNHMSQDSFQPQNIPQREHQEDVSVHATTETTRGRGNNLPSHLSMDKVFYCGGKR